jgi:hypothetical protein
VFVAGDCAAPDPAAGARAVEVDRRLTVDVPRDRVACLVTDTPRAFELIWHAHAPIRMPASVMAVQLSAP